MILSTLLKSGFGGFHYFKDEAKKCFMSPVKQVEVKMETHIDSTAVSPA